jgi:hypothetical protein
VSTQTPRQPGTRQDTSTYSGRRREYAEVVRSVAQVVFEGGQQDGARTAAVQVRAEVLAEVVAALRSEARRGERGAPVRQRLDYAGGLRRAVAIVEGLR